MKTQIITERSRPDEVLLTSAELAARWKVLAKSVANMRARGDGPRYRKLPNRLVRYPDWAVSEYEIGL